MPGIPKDQKQRILGNVWIDPVTNCWNWMGQRDRLGYGKIRVAKKGIRHYWQRCHRYARAVWIGPIPDGQLVLHSCDNRGCCNPEHTWLGTQKDHMQDMHSKGRGPKGYKRDPAICASNVRKRHAN